MNRKKLVLICVLVLSLSSCDRPMQPSESLKPWDSAMVMHLLNSQLTEAVVQDGFSPPVASRIYAYTNIAAYETLVGSGDSSKLPSLSGKFPGLELPLPKENAGSFDSRVAVVSAFHDVAVEMVYRDYLIDSVEVKLLSSLKELVSDPIVYDRSLQYGKAIAKKIIEWSTKDGYTKTRNLPRYVPTGKVGAWVPTPPTYGEAVEPYWFRLRPFIMDSASQFSQFPPPEPFSTEKGSSFHNYALQVYRAGKNLTEDQIKIAKHWDCNPQVSVIHGHLMGIKRQLTPPGHWIGIVRTVAKENDLSFGETIDIYTRVSLVMADAFISAWHEKYRSDLIRPETYINQYIDSNWRPLLETPLFPEHISAHSAISRGAAVVLSDFFGDNYSFVDSVEVPFGLPPRRFESFIEASDEAAKSRIYGGIHYYPGYQLGVLQGDAIGVFHLNKLKPKKRGGG